MTLVVQKFGGTSVGGTDRIDAVAERVLAARDAGREVVVVVSAMAGETDRLLGLARAISTHGRPNPRELDVLLATGEQVTIALLCMALEKRGITARSFTGRQAGIVTDSGHTRARILEIRGEALLEEIRHGRVPVVAGFQGVDAAGNITTLGRGGSDTTAVAIAAALRADECQIHTDVSGVYTTDPRIEPNARRLERISYEEMLELAGQGSKVLQVRSVEFASRYKVPVRVLSTFESGAGTLIAEGNGTVEAPEIVGIASSRDEAELRVSAPSAELLPGMIGALAGSRIEIDLIVQNLAVDGSANVTFTVSRQDYDQAREILAHFFRASDVRIEGDSRVAKVSVIGNGIRAQRADVAARMLDALAREGIVARQIATSQIRISVVVRETEMERAVRALHHEFGLQHAVTGREANA